jgi:two-component system nitrogen regulation response regulator NtrX
MTSLLIVEDDPKIRANLVFQLRESGFVPHAAESAEAALMFLAEHEAPDLLLCDVRLPGLSGIELVRQLVAEQRLPPTVIVSGEASITETVEALKLGVHDFIEKPFSRERLQQSIRNALENASLRREVQALRTELGVASELLGDSPGMARLRGLIERAARTDARVLILGESGTGKELVAGALHRQGARAKGPLIKINCAAIPEHLIEDELFGHAKGAFTDARMAKAGLFEEAHGGTLFLDEIGDMSYSLQSRLLRVLEDGRVRRLGETRDREVDVRVLAATHQDLEKAVRENRFREDLYFRLAALPLEIPPLRTRGDDIRRLFDFFAEHFAKRHNLRVRRVDPAVYPALLRYRWPGNVRELRNLCERLVVFGGDPLTCDDLPSAFFLGESTESPAETGLLQLRHTMPLMPLRQFREHCEKEYIEAVLRRSGWNFSAAARQLDIQRTYLHQKAASLGLRRPDAVLEADEETGN